MRQRWRVVLVDEFQDTDPVQWRVIESAFSGHSTLILIGDPKQAIYGFRGGDIHTYLKAARAADARYTLGTNWRSDEALVESLQTVMGGAALGHPDIVVHDVDVHHADIDWPGHHTTRRSGCGCQRPTVGCSGTTTFRSTCCASHITADLAADIGALLDSRATSTGGRAGPRHRGDRRKHDDARACRDALAPRVSRRSIPATDVFDSQAAKDWLCLLEAFDQPHRSGLVRAAACTMFFGETAETLPPRVMRSPTGWLDAAGVGRSRPRARGGRGVRGRAGARHGPPRLGQRGGERDMTDLAHITQLLQETAHRDHCGLPALRDWLRAVR